MKDLLEPVASALVMPRLPDHGGDKPSTEPSPTTAFRRNDRVRPQCLLSLQRDAPVNVFHPAPRPAPLRSAQLPQTSPSSAPASTCITMQHHPTSSMSCMSPIAIPSVIESIRAPTVLSILMSMPLPVTSLQLPACLSHCREQPCVRSQVSRSIGQSMVDARRRSCRLPPATGMTSRSTA